MKRFFALILILVLLCGCSAPVEVEAPADSSMLADGAEVATETEPAENIGAEETAEETAAEDSAEELGYGKPEAESPDWGITLTTENVTPTGLTLICTQKGGNPSGELHTGSYYAMEQFVDDAWQPCDCYAEVAWTDEGWNLTQDGTVTWDITWDWLCGTLTEGHYRIGKEILDIRAPGDLDKAMYYAEFDVAAPQFAEYSALYADFRVPVPDGWSYDIVACGYGFDGDDTGEVEAEPANNFGIILWPDDDPSFTVEVYAWAGGFGMCGTGVDFEEITLKNGGSATLASEIIADGGGEAWNTLIYHGLPGDYTAIWHPTLEEEQRYDDAVWSIIGGTELGCESLPEDEIIAIAAEECGQDPADGIAHFDLIAGEWSVEFLCEPYHTGSFITIGTDGTVLTHAIACR